MRSRTISIDIAVPADTVYRCVRDPEQLPLWAAGICKSVTVQEGVWHVDTGTELGTVQMAFCADNSLGVLDHTVTLPDGRSQNNPMRVIANGEGSEVMLTVFQTEGMSDETFVRDVQAVTRDLKTIKMLLETQR
ncbi:MAG: SRPBCC family protein [Rhodocyclaceae bacterium]|nr:SRPBCC family protein [Rhodocyclaceae bacterium]